jgi:hypothetical protein
MNRRHLFNRAAFVALSAVLVAMLTLAMLWFVAPGAMDWWPR